MLWQVYALMKCSCQSIMLLYNSSFQPEDFFSAATGLNQEQFFFFNTISFSQFNTTFILCKCVAPFGNSSRGQQAWIKSYSLVQSSWSPNTGIFSWLLTWLLDCWEKDALAFPIVCSALKPLHSILPYLSLPFLPFPPSSVTRTSPGCSGCVSMCLPRILESFSSNANLSF